MDAVDTTSRVEGDRAERRRATARDSALAAGGVCGGPACGRRALDHAGCNGARALFRADWERVVFIHFALPPAALASAMGEAGGKGARPGELDLDLWEGMAHVSLVAFTQRRLRPSRGGRLGALLCAPLSDHAFLNVRTYVRHRGEPGIFFLAEWIPNRLAALVGPRLYGLPYRLGRLDYRHELGTDQFVGEVRAGSAALRYSARAAGDRALGGKGGGPAAAGSLAEYLVERYAAFTLRRGKLRRFAVRHAPWRLMEIDARIEETGLLRRTGDWMERAVLCGAQASAGVKDVEIGWPEAIA